MANQQDMLPCCDPQKNFLGPFVQLKKQKQKTHTNFKFSLLDRAVRFFTK